MVLGSSDYNKKWNSDYTSKEGIRDKLRSSTITNSSKATYRRSTKKVTNTDCKLEGMSSKMQEKDKIIFSRIVNAMQNHDSHYGKLLSGELSKIRKMIKMIDSAKVTSNKYN